jgi:hypothetical protein
VKGNTKADLQINRNVQLRELMEDYQFGPVQRQCEIWKKTMSISAN